MLNVQWAINSQGRFAISIKLSPKQMLIHGSNSNDGPTDSPFFFSSTFEFWLYFSCEPTKRRKKVEKKNTKHTEFSKKKKKEETPVKYSHGRYIYYVENWI